MTASKISDSHLAGEALPIPLGTWLRKHRVLVGCWFATLVIGSSLLVNGSEEMLIRFGIGDGLAYTRVAFNIAHGHGSTYDLVAPTNGYHPLWLWLHVPLFLAAPDILSRMWLVELFWITTAVAASVAWSLFIWRATQNEIVAGLSCVMIGGFGWSLYVLYSGVETPLVFLMLAMVCLGLDKLANSQNPPASLCVGLAAAAAGTFLARLDTAFLLAALAVAFAKPLLRCEKKRAVLGALVFFVTSLPYLLWNILVFGRLMPVSGVAKTTAFSMAALLTKYHLWAKDMQGIGAHPVALAGIAVLCLGLVSLAAVGLVRSCPRFARIVLPVGAGAVLQYAYYFLFIGEANVPWHLYPQVLTFYLGTLGVLVIVGKLIAKRIAEVKLQRFLAAVVYLGVAFAFSGITYEYYRVKQVHRGEVREAVALGRWIRQHVPPTARIAMYDSFWVGAVAHQHALVDLNGLVGDLPTALLHRDSRFVDLIKLKQCDYVVVHQRDVTIHPAVTRVFPGLSQTIPNNGKTELSYFLLSLNGG